MSQFDACAMDQPETTACACEHSDEVPVLPYSTEDCPFGCLNCNLEAHVADIELTVPPSFRGEESRVVSAALVRMPVAVWSPEPAPFFVRLDAPPRPSPSTAWGVWRL